MLAYWLEKRWVQYTTLIVIVAVMVVYWGFFFKFGYEFDWSVLFEVNPTYQEHFGLVLLQGLVLTIKISLISSGIALALGTFFGLGRLASFAPLRWLSTAYVEFFRNTPLLIQLFFWYFAFPMGLPQAARNYVFGLNYEFWCATIGLSVYTGSFMAEVIRAGLQSIPRGLLESAYSSGLSYLQVLRSIILPLAFRSIIPPLGSEFLNNMKNSSLAMVVGVAELTWSSQQVESLTFRGFEATTGATVLYLALSLVISGLLNLVNVKLKIQPSARTSWNQRAADLLFSPLSLVWAAASRLTTAWYAKRAGGRATLVRSPLQAAAIQVRHWAAAVVALAFKTAFVAALVYVGFKLIQGLMGFNWQVIWDNLDTLLIWRFPHGSENELFWGLGGLAYSILMAVIAISVSFFIGLAAGLGRASSNQLFRLPCMVYIEVIRGNPLIIVIFWVYFFIPIVTGAFFDVFWSATVALTIFTGAYLAEIVRSGVQNIPSGQVEAAYSTGLSYFQTMRRIILPQALKQMIPAIVGQFIAIFKDTSLAFVIGVLELTFVAQGLNNRLMVYPFEIYTTVAFLYFICCYAMSCYARRLEARLSPEKQSLVM
ncbi:amino acid ABC transporter permease [Desulfovermiculus halophilus]|jgi:polar amino acid transport system permease protein|uniref:amino acid ABC transporter permease n=1 Tax=Desulfovermiculus halophilus TaxID=339722 RepID=UPI0004842459|nr:amino acid ABC transporter permease [Desulfovermiculus halophilus]